MTIAVGNVSKDALRITNTNRNHLDSADRIRTAVGELRDITNRNAEGMKATLNSTSGLSDSARELGEIMDSMIGGGNGYEKPKRSRTKKLAADEGG